MASREGCSHRGDQETQERKEEESILHKGIIPRDLTSFSLLSHLLKGSPLLMALKAGT